MRQPLGRHRASHFPTACSWRSGSSLRQPGCPRAHRSSCLRLQTARVKGVRHHTWLSLLFNPKIHFQRYDAVSKKKNLSLVLRLKTSKTSTQGDLNSNKSEEIEAMAAIYGEEWCVIDDRAKIFCIRISDDIDDPKWTLCLQVMLPSEYPGTAPPVYQLNAPWLKGQERADLSNSLEEIYIQNIGESILYLWVEKIRDVLIQKAQVTEPEANIFAAVLSSQRSGERVESVFFDFWIHVLISQHSKLMRNIPDVKKKTKEKKVERDVNVGRRRPGNSAKKSDRNVSEHVPEVEELPPIDHGVPITDRRSTFQAHVAPVSCFKQVEMVLAKLYENKKVASATHNVYAYRS
ncbi:protein IMPACT isoform X4 [Mesocricetus auratus]|uniref:Protein IMPACT isoform X4 n=1 Tax=Mesocricetus auratus TaxID=10036 RepID=A0ABM2YG91_MESAU|nr:protein IMPACT isoform X4 [Mesocricetus auratus]